MLAMKFSWPWPKMVFCAFATSVPLLFGYSMGQLGMAIFGGLFGYMMVINDSTGPLIRQRYMHFTVTITIMLCGLFAGVMLVGQPIWVALILFAFAYAMGLMGAQGTELELTLLFTVFLFLVGFNSPFLLSIYRAVLIYAGVSYLTVLIGAALLMRWPLEDKIFSPYKYTVGLMRTNELVKHLYALVLACSVLGAYLFVRQFDIDHGYWAVASILLIMRPDPKLSLHRAIQRLLGTALGVGLATLITHQTNSAPVLIALISLCSFFVPASLNRRYWMTSALIGVIVLLLLGLASGHKETDHLAWIRIEATALGFFFTILAMAVFIAFRRLAIGDSKRSL